MATTTNFGWETPDDTDLVKDGAAAIRTALGGVDTSFVDLKGGTTGQVLSKASNTDLDYTWVPNSGPAFFVYRSTNQSTTQNAFTKIQFNAENYDTANCFDSTTNFRFTPNVAGYYQINATVTSQTAAGEGFSSIYKNGIEYYQLGRRQPQGVGVSAGIVIPMNGTTDYLEVFFYGTAAATGIEGVSAQAGTLFSGVWIRSL
jgi:hypothetical protein